VRIDGGVAVAGPMGPPAGWVQPGPVGPAQLRRDRGRRLDAAAFSALQATVRQAWRDQLPKDPLGCAWLAARVSVVLLLNWVGNVVAVYVLQCSRRLRASFPHTNVSWCRAS
jgi:hypothetical protein